MTREEVIRCFWYFSNVAGSGKNVVALTRRDKEAFDMAIEALSAEPCEDAISRKATLEPYRVLENTDTLCVALIRANIKQQPPVTPQLKMGHWIDSEAVLVIGYSDTDNFMRLPACECSVCHKPHIRGYGMDYCPNCGAKMEGEQ